MTHQVVTFGEILFDIIGHVAKPGGAPFNVAYHLKQADVDTFLISSVGDDAYGKELLHTLAAWGLSTDGIDVNATQQTGTAVVHHDENNQPEFELLYPVAWDYIPWKEEYASIIRNAGVFLFGSLSSRHDQSYRTLKECLKHSQLNVFDINIRAPYFNRPLLEELLQYANILKMNSDELVLLSGWYGKQDDEEAVQVAAIRELFHIDEVLVTKGGEGASYYSDAMVLHRPAVDVQVADTVGSGDAFLAGFLSKRLDPECPISECLTEGLKKGAYVASQYGACPSYDGYGSNH